MPRRREILQLMGWVSSSWVVASLSIPSVVMVAETALSELPMVVTVDPRHAGNGIYRPEYHIFPLHP